MHKWWLLPNFLIIYLTPNFFWILILLTSVVPKAIEKQENYPMVIINVNSLQTWVLSGFLNLFSLSYSLAIGPFAHGQVNFVLKLLVCKECAWKRFFLPWSWELDDEKLQGILQTNLRKSRRQHYIPPSSFWLSAFSFLWKFPSFLPYMAENY